MPASPKPYDSIWKWLRDVVLAFLILVGGFILADLMARPFRNLTHPAYVAALCIAGTPFWWFTRRCHVHSLDFYDYAALCVFALFAAAFQLAAPGIQSTLSIVLIAVAFGVFLAACGWIRRKLGRPQ